MTDKEILMKAILTFGGYKQEQQSIEECSELIQAICHKHRGREHNIEEEIADVEIMLEQLKIINNCGDKVEAIRKYKIKLLYKKLYNLDEDINRCVCCGEVIPEGRQVCPKCESGGLETMTDRDRLIDKQRKEDEGK